MSSSAIIAHSIDIQRHLSRLSSTSVISELVASKLLIGTHDGSFHCDEALATSLLLLLPKFEGACILRSRNPALLESCDTVVDVGAVYDPTKNRYDHHQRDFNGILEPFQTKLSSAGLVFKHFGMQILSEVISPPYDDDTLRVFYRKVYQDFVEHIDAIDNGIAVSLEPPRYRITTTLSDRVSYLNPSWNEPQTPKIMNERFKAAMSLTCTEFLSYVDYLSVSWWPARSIVINSIKGRYSVHPSGSVIILDQYCPWKDHLLELEAEVRFKFSI